MPETDGGAIVVNAEVRSTLVSPPRAPRRPFSTVTTYRVDVARRPFGVKVAAVASSFQLIRPGTTAPTGVRTVMPPPAERSIGWLKVIVTACCGLANWVLSSGEIAATPGVTVVKLQRWSSARTPSAALLRVFATRTRYVVVGRRSVGMNR